MFGWEVSDILGLEHYKCSNVILSIGLNIEE